MSLETRPARPSDVDAAVPLIFCSGEHEHDYGFATRRHRATDFIRAAFLGHSKSDIYRGFRVAVVDGRVVGIGSFLGGGDFGASNSLRFLWDVLRVYGLREFWGVLRRGLRLQGVMPPLAKVGVSPEMRWRGVGTTLISEQVAAAREHGFRRCVLDVEVTNPDAQRLYQRLGFRVTGQTTLDTTEPAADVPSQRRMELVL